MADSREFSAGGVIVRRQAGGGWEAAVIRPQGRPKVVALPKGHIDPGESAAQAAQREVLEETGLSGVMLSSLGEVQYTYRFRGKSVLKQVSFFVFEWASGEIDLLTEAMRPEVEQAYWLPLDEVCTRLSYEGERSMAQRARSVLEKNTRPTDANR